MVKIRLARAGAKKRPFYHLVAADSRSPRDGRFIERLGFFNPIAAGEEVRLRVNIERVDHWLARGAQLTERAAKLVGGARTQFSPVPESCAPATEDVSAEADAAATVGEAADETGAEAGVAAADNTDESDDAPRDGNSGPGSEASPEASGEPAREA